MRAVWLEVPEWFLEERRRLGHDRKDEVWDGVIHMVPPGSSVHGLVIIDLVVALHPVAKRRGLRACSGELGLFDPIKGVKNYRIPDLSIVRPEQISKRGIEGAELVVEVLSPHDESRDKFPFYAQRGIREIWLIEPTTRVPEVYRLRNGAFVQVEATDGALRSPVLDIELRVIDGPRLRIIDGSYVADV